MAPSAPARRTLHAVALLTLAAALAVPGPAEAVEPLRIGILPIADALPFFVMEAEGRPQSLRIVPFASALERDAGLESGQIDGCVTDPLASAMMLSGGMDVVLASLLLGEAPSEGRFAILSAPGSPIRTPAELKGVPIGISSSTVIEYVTDSLLAGAGLAPGQIVKEEVKKIPVRTQMLLAGQLQAATLPDPLAFFAQAKGAHLVLDDTQGANLSQVVLLLGGKALTGKAEAVREVFAAYDDAAARINASPESFRKLLAERARLPEEIAATYPVDHFPRAQLPDRESIERVLAWAGAKGLLPRPVTYEDLTGRSPLR